tara:strand:+ start:107 stop:400 length:294 start_codon:yes stop_codon:yes gene_type:complete
MDAKFTIEVKEIESLGKSRKYVDIFVNKGNTQLHILFFGTTFDVFRTVNGKSSVIASRMGKTFWSWSEVCGNYKSLTEFLESKAPEVLQYENKISSL